jgi:simple sugar transport system permease protein
MIRETLDTMRRVFAHRTATEEAQDAPLPRS